MSVLRCRASGLVTALLLALWQIPAEPAQTAMSDATFAVRDFDTVTWQGSGELTIEQTGREQLTVEAEPAVLARVIASVERGRLTLGFKPGNTVTRQGIRWHLEVRSLKAFESQGSGSVSVGSLQTRQLALTLSGSGTVQIAHLTAHSLAAELNGSEDLAIDTGRLDEQHIVITGAADYQAPRLRTQTTHASIEGSGRIEVAATESLYASIEGSGDVRYYGQPRVKQSIGGAGVVDRISSH